VIASGGIADGRGLAAALCLGACAVNMGTRFMATTEAPIHPNVKQQLVSNSERDTVLVFRNLRNTARVAPNSLSEEIERVGRGTDSTFAEVAELASGVRGRREVSGAGHLEGGMWWAGQAQGLTKDIVSVGELVERIVAQAHDILGNLYQPIGTGGRSGQQFVV
jgi:NAD(P)H-dependent flavin oxidoreductase YrpB (nitropropane dioxygenase family)